MKEFVFGLMSIVAIVLGLAFAPGLIMAIWFESLMWLKIAGTCFLSSAWLIGMVKIGDGIF